MSKTEQIGKSMRKEGSNLQQDANSLHCELPLGRWLDGEGLDLNDVTLVQGIQGFLCCLKQHLTELLQSIICKAVLDFMQRQSCMHLTAAISRSN